MRKSVQKFLAMNIKLFSDSEIDGLLEMAGKAALEKFDRLELTTLPDPTVVKALLRTQLSWQTREVFGILLLDCQHRVLKNEPLFFGTIDAAPVYTRVVVQKALSINAGAVLLYHNHPSGIAEPSRADRAITEKLVSALALIDVKVLDHVVVSGIDAVSFAERGWL